MGGGKKVGNKRSLLVHDLVSLTSDTQRKNVNCKQYKTLKPAILSLSKKQRLASSDKFNSLNVFSLLLKKK